jgi:hypothetical protein
MPTRGWTPSIVPEDDHDTYLVVDDLGRLGQIWCEADFQDTDFETLVTDLLDGQYSNPIRVVAFNATKGWARDASAEIATELRRRCDLQTGELPSSIADFVEMYEASRNVR